VSAGVREVLSRNLAVVGGRIAEAAQRVGREADDVTLVVVTKTVSPEVIALLPDLGVHDVGENRVQALTERAQALNRLGLRWHMIGHLQRNKARKVLPFTHLLHAIDSLRLAETVNRVAGELDRPAEALIQVNVSGEASKFGLEPAEATDLIRRAPEWPHLRIAGLMTMAPFVSDPETVRPVFVALRELAERIRGDAPPGVEMRHLSMGMTQDYVQAVEEGATIVRIGTAVFKGL